MVEIDPGREGITVKVVAIGDIGRRLTIRGIPMVMEDTDVVLVGISTEI